MLNLDDYVVDVLMRDLVGHDRRPASFLVYVWLTAEQERRQGAVQVSYQELAESVGLSKSSAQTAVSWLGPKKTARRQQRNRHSYPELHSTEPLEGCCTPRQSPTR